MLPALSPSDDCTLRSYRLTNHTVARVDFAQLFFFFIRTTDRFVSLILQYYDVFLCVTSCILILFDTVEKELTVHEKNPVIPRDFARNIKEGPRKQHPPPPGAVVAFFHDSGAEYKTADLLTCLLYFR